MSSTQAQTNEAPKSDDSVLLGLEFPRPQWSDALAGVSVALVLIPQCIAYAAIAGMPPAVGLYASALPLIVFSFFASSPYLQTGPVATTSLLTGVGLAAAGFMPELEAGLGAGVIPPYVAAGMLLALIVGIIRIVFGVLRLGWVAYLISDPVMIGFTSGAAIIIMASQFPKCVGLTSNPMLGPLDNFLIALKGIGLWSTPAIALSLATVALMVIGRKFHRLFPGVLLAVLIGLLATKLGVVVPTVGTVPSGLPNIAFSFPFGLLPGLLFPAIVIAFVGFAEPSAIARMFANEDGAKWNANREFFASGLANIASAVSGGYPVGGSFSRSSVNRMSGASTRWSGGVTGLCLTAFLPFAGILGSLPKAVLGGIVLAAVYRLTKPRRMLRLWWRCPMQATLAWTTFAATIYTTPKIHYAVLLGVGLTLILHIARRFDVAVETESDSQVTLRPRGLLWFGTQDSFRDQLQSAAAEHLSKDVCVNLGKLIAMDARSIETLASLSKQIHPRRLTIINSPWETGDDVRAAIERASLEI